MKVFKNSSPRLRPLCGFSLIELIVCVAVVAILVAIAGSFVGKARDSARAVESTNNLRQLGTAFMLYAAANDSVLPPVTNAAWARSVYVYVYNTEPPDPFFDSHMKAENLRGTVYDCPFGEQSGEPEPIRRFAMNAFLQRDFKSISTNSLTDPSKTMLLATSQRSGALMHHWWNFSDRANGMVLVQFADLSIQRFETDAIPPLRTDIFWKGTD